MITKPLLQRKIAESQAKIEAWVTALNQESAKIESYQELMELAPEEENIPVPANSDVPEGFQPAISEESQIDG